MDLSIASFFALLPSPPAEHDRCAFASYEGHPTLASYMRIFRSWCLLSKASGLSFNISQSHLLPTGSSNGLSCNAPWNAPDALIDDIGGPRIEEEAESRKYDRLEGRSSHTRTHAATWRLLLESSWVWGDDCPKGRREHLWNCIWTLGRPARKALRPPRLRGRGFLATARELSIRGGCSTPTHIVLRLY